MSTSNGTIVLTGANGGLGCGIVSIINANPGFHKLYLVRNAENATSLRSAVEKSKTSAPYDILSLDLASLTSVRQVARSVNDRIAAKEIPPIRALILNAGYNDLGHESYTEDGFDTAFVVNYLGQWLLCMLLLQSMDRDNGRIVVVSSNSYDVAAPVHQMDGYYADEKWRLFFHDDNIDAIAHGTWSSNKDDMPRRAGVRRYGVSKMCSAMMVGELQSRLDVDPALSHVSISAVDPGAMGGTGLVRRGNWFTRTILFPVIFRCLGPFLTWYSPNGTIRTISKSSADVWNAAIQTDIKLRGSYLNGSELQPMVPEAVDPRKRAMVWRDSVKYTKLTEEETALAKL
ncbi:putative short-chain dehydrogenase [Xylaria sp. CBS 124048]|nr:putative short-chain dehydrogenase [Xylaria sp. CBS 124048]